jgi:hypothetical protein
MAWTAPNDDVIVQEGVFMYGYECSGTVVGGQPVYALGTMQAKGLTAESNSFVGVAAYPQTNGNMLGVYGPGNVVRGIVSGTAVAAGDKVSPTASGWKDATALISANAIALESQSTDGGTIRLLLI